MLIFFSAYLCAAAHLLTRAKHLEIDPRGRSRTYTQLAVEYAQPRPFSARSDCLDAYQEIMDASYALQDCLPEQHQINLLETPPWSDPDTPLIVSTQEQIRSLCKLS